MEMHEQPTTELDPREVVLAYLERARADWLPAHHRAVRAGGLSAEANLAEAERMRVIDNLLDELVALGGTAVGQTVEVNYGQARNV